MAGHLQYVACPMRSQHTLAIIASHCYCCRGTDRVPVGFAIELALLGVDDVTYQALGHRDLARRLFIYELKLRHHDGEHTWITHDEKTLADYGSAYSGDWRVQLVAFSPDKYTLVDLEDKYPRSLKEAT